MSEHEEKCADVSCPTCWSDADRAGEYLDDVIRLRRELSEALARAERLATEKANIVQAIIHQQSEPQRTIAARELLADELNGLRASVGRLREAAEKSRELVQALGRLPNWSERCGATITIIDAALTTEPKSP